MGEERPSEVHGGGGEGSVANVEEENTLKMYLVRSRSELKL